MTGLRYCCQTQSKNLAFLSPVGGFAGKFENKNKLDNLIARLLIIDHR
jgi:hypothetical protein